MKNPRLLLFTTAALVSVATLTWLARSKGGASAGSDAGDGGNATTTRVPMPPSIPDGAAAPGGQVTEARRLADLPESMARQQAITAFVAGLKNPADCAALATNLTAYGHALSGAALQRWVELDAPGAIRDYAMPMRHRELRASNLDWMFRDYAAQDPVAAFEYARSLEGLAESERQASVAATLPALAKVDVATAVASLRELPAGMATVPATEIYTDLARHGEPAKVFADAGELRGNARAVAQQSVLKVTAGQNPDAAVALWHGVDNAALRHDLTRALADGFVEAGVNSRDMVNWLFENAPERGADAVRAEALGRLAATDPTAATTLLNQRPVGERDDLRGMLAGTMDPAQGLEFARGIARDELRQEAYAQVASRFGSEDPQRLYQEFGKDPEFARAALPAVVEALAYEQIGTATDYVNQLPDELRDAAATRLVERLTDLSPERALKVAATAMTDPDARQQAMAGAYAAAVVGRTGTDTAGLPGVPSGTNRDRLFASVVPLVAFRNPTSAWQVANAIGDENLRLNAVQEVLRGYAATESTAAAERRLAAANLPADVVEQMRAQLAP
jgi:hypothetical protein